MTATSLAMRTNKKGIVVKDTDLSFHLGWMHNRKFLKQLQQDNIDAYLLQREVCLIEKQQKQKTWRGKLLHILRSNPVQVILCALVLLDALIVVAEIIVEMHAERAAKKYLKDDSSKAVGFLRANFPETLQHLPKEAHLSELVAKLNEINATCLEPTSEPKLSRHKRAAGTVSADGKIRHPYGPHFYLLITVAHKLHYISIAILALFVFDVLLKMLCEGRHFFREPFEVVDGVIIFLSFAADIAMLKLNVTETSVMIVFLLWRMVRVINGFMVHEKQRDEFRIQMQKRARRMCEMRIDGLKTEKELMEKHVKLLEGLSRNQGASEEQIFSCKPRYLIHSPKQTNNALKSMAALTGGFMRDLVNAKSRLDISDRHGSAGAAEESSEPAADSGTGDASRCTPSSSSSSPPPPCSSSSFSSAVQGPPDSGDAADGVSLRLSQRASGQRPHENGAVANSHRNISFSSGPSRVNSEELSIFATSTEQIVFVDSSPTDIDLSKPSVFENEAYVTKL